MTNKHLYRQTHPHVLLWLDGEGQSVSRKQSWEHVLYMYCFCCLFYFEYFLSAPMWFQGIPNILVIYRTFNGFVIWCCIMGNLLETMFIKYGLRKDRKSHFYMHIFSWICKIHGKPRGNVMKIIEDAQIITVQLLQFAVPSNIEHRIGVVEL